MIIQPVDPPEVIQTLQTVRSSRLVGWIRYETLPLAPRLWHPQDGTLCTFFGALQSMQMYEQ